MDHWIKQAYMEQHRDRMLQQAAKGRLLQRAKEDQSKDLYPAVKEVRSMLKRRLAFAASLIIVVAFWLARIVEAAGGGGGGGRHLVM